MSKIIGIDQTVVQLARHMPVFNLILDAGLDVNEAVSVMLSVYAAKQRPAPEPDQVYWEDMLGQMMAEQLRAGVSLEIFNTMVARFVRTFLDAERIRRDHQFDQACHRLGIRVDSLENDSAGVDARE